MIIKQLNKGDGSWSRFVNDWRNQCGQFDEEFETYAGGEIALFQALIDAPEDRAGIFAVEEEGGGSPLAAFQANLAHLPGYDGPVLRIRLIKTSPAFDLGDKPIEDYVALLLSLFQGALTLSDNELPARHVKFHFASPADRRFFAAVGTKINGTSRFESVIFKGSWLYISKMK